jgi:hypothetical protein
MVKNSVGMHGSKGEQRHAHAWRTRVPIDSPRSRSRWCVVQNLVWSSPAHALLPCHGSSVVLQCLLADVEGHITPSQTTPRPPFFLLTRHLAGVRSQQHASSRSCSSEALILLASPPLAAVEPVANKCLLLIPQRWN